MIGYYLRKAKHKSLGQLPKWALNGVSKRVRYGLQTIQCILFPPSYKRIFDKVFHEIGSSKEEIIEKLIGNLGSSYFISWEERDLFVTHFKSIFPTRITKQIIEDANQVLDHVFDLLGSGKKCLNRKIDWRADLYTGTRWPLYRSKDVPIICPPGDIIRVWELCRFQWGPTLGKAYWLTGEEKYIKEFFIQVEDWCKKNPIGFGPNWISSQDVALRAINWIMTLCFMGDSLNVSQKSWINILSCLYMHGTRIESNLSIGYIKNEKITGTHYLSEVLGLLWLGLLFRNIETGKRWLDFAISEISLEMKNQVNPDGCDYESSIACYHRFALEHFLYAYLLFLRNDIEVPIDFIIRLEKMFEFVLAYTRPDGTVPQIGDNCDGRVLILSAYSGWKNNDHRYLLPALGTIFGRTVFENSVIDSIEENFWLTHALSSNGHLPIVSFGPKNLNLSESVGFSDTGFYFMKGEGAYMVISANPVGMKGKGNHKHNDIFSFDMFFKDTSFIVDPGSYVYTSNLKERHLFRSTKYHNTFQINDFEQNIIDVNKPWRVEEAAHPKVTTWETTPHYDLFIGEHFGYDRYIENIIIERLILFDKSTMIWIIQDRIKGNPDVNNETNISVYFHLNDLEHRIVDSVESWRLPKQEIYSRLELGTDEMYFENSVEVSSPGSSIVIKSIKQNHLKLEIMQGWISNRYGIKTPSPIITFSGPYMGQSQFTFAIKAKYIR